MQKIKKFIIHNSSFLIVFMLLIMPAVSFVQAANPTMVASDITATSVNVKATGLEPNKIYVFEIKSASLVSETGQPISTDTASGSFSNLTPDKTYTIDLSKYDPETGAKINSGVPGSVSFKTLATGGGGTGDTGGGGGLVPCNNTPDDKGIIAQPCDFNALMALVNKVIKFILFDMVIPIAAIMFAYAGFELVTSGGSTEKRGKAKKIFTDAIIGFILAIAAFLIIRTILSILGYKGSWIGFDPLAIAPIDFLLVLYV